MTTPRIYEIDWAGKGSNIFFFACCLFFTFFIVLFLRTIIHNLKMVSRDRNERSIWASAGSLLLSLSSLILIAVIGGVAARYGGSGSGALGAGTEGAVQGYARSIKPNARSWLAVSLLGFPLLTSFLIWSVSFEQPLKLSISANQVVLLYRLPWRDKSILFTTISDVILQRHDYLEHGTMHSHFYTITIVHSGKATCIWCNRRPWYEDQLKAAYQGIRSNLDAEATNPKN